MKPQLIAGVVILVIACAATGRAVHNHWQAKYTALELSVAQSRAEGEKAAREALQEAHRRDLAEAEARAARAAEAVREARNEAQTIQNEADRLAKAFAEARREPDCDAWADTAIACVVSLHPAFTAGAGDNRGAGAGQVRPDPLRADEIVQHYPDGTGEKRRPVPAVAGTSGRLGGV